MNRPRSRICVVLLVLAVSITLVAGLLPHVVFRVPLALITVWGLWRRRRWAYPLALINGAVWLLMLVLMSPFLLVAPPWELWLPWLYWVAPTALVLTATALITTKEGRAERATWDVLGLPQQGGHVTESATVDPRASYLAPKKLRLANFVCDWLLALIYSSLVAIFLALFGFGSWLENMGNIERYLFSNAVYVLYYVTFEGAFGWTFAKLITKTRVVDESGAKPGFANLLGRSLCRIVPFEPFSFLGKNPVGWHDSWSGTRVIALRQSTGQTLAESFAIEREKEHHDQKPAGWEAMSEAQRAIWEMKQQKSSK